MRGLLFIIFNLTLLACVRQNSTDNLVAQDLKYSAFLWHLSPDNDSFNFYLAHYVDIDKNGHYKLMRRDSFMSRPKFFKGSLSDALRKLIDSTFAKESFKTEYKWNMNDNVAYDGFTYCFDFRKPDSNKEKKILFIPNKAPNQINDLAIALDTLIYNSTATVIDTLDTHLYQEGLKQYYTDKYGQLPKVHIEHPKFKPAKIQK